MPTLRTVRPAGNHDDLSDADYRDIYEELRTGHTLRQFIELSGSGYSPTWWNQYAAGGKELTHRARNDLRRAVGLPDLPPTTAESLATVAPDAAIVQVGDDTQAGRVLLLATGDDVTIVCNGDGWQVAPVGLVTPVTSGAAGKAGQTDRQPRRERRKAIKVDPDLYDELNAARRIAGLSWPAFLGRLRER